MTDPITIPASMREAVEQAVLAEKMRMMSWCAKRQAVSRKAWERAARKALAGDMAELRNRIALIDAGPLDIVQSDAGDDALPVAEPEPLAVRVKPLSDEDRDWIDARADELFRANERRRGGIRNQTITPQDFRDYFVVTATRERILSQIEAVSVAQVRAEALEEAAKLATSFLVGDPKNGVPLRNPLAHEIADAIRAMKGAMR